MVSKNGRDENITKKTTTKILAQHYIYETETFTYVQKIGLLICFVFYF